MKQILCWFLAALCIQQAKGGENGKGIRSIGLAGARAMLPGDPWALVNNPAVLSLAPEARISAFMTPSLFGLRELRTIALCGTFPVAGESASLSIEQFGFDLYREFGATLGLGRSIAKGISCGIAFEWRRTEIRRYGTSHGLIASGGWAVELTEELRMGFVGDNILGETIGIVRQRLPQKAAMGISYEPLSSMLIVVEGEKDTRYPLTTKIGLEIRAQENLLLRTGLAHDPNIVSCGLTIRYGGAEFGYAGYGHPQLGWTHQIEASVRWGN